MLIWGEGDEQRHRMSNQDNTKINGRPSRPLWVFIGHGGRGVYGETRSVHTVKQRANGGACSREEIAAKRLIDRSIEPTKRQARRRNRSRRFGTQQPGMRNTAGQLLTTAGISHTHRIWHIPADMRFCGGGRCGDSRP